MSQTSTLKGQCIAEFLGTGLLIFFGVGCVAALKVAGASFGQWEISVIWGLGVAMAIYLTAGVSGAHLNPAVTIALWLFACFDKRKVIPFIVSQVAGAFCAAALVYGLYYNLFFDFEQTGFAMNPARDFGPKVFAWLAGWGNVAFTGGRDIPYFLVPLFGPIVGAIVGAFAYRKLIGRHLPCDICVVEEKETTTPSEQKASL